MLRRILSLILPDRRQTEAKRYRELVSLIVFVESMTPEQWFETWMHTLGKDKAWLPKDIWLEHLRQQAAMEANRLLIGVKHAA